MQPLLRSASRVPVARMLTCLVVAFAVPYAAHSQNFRAVPAGAGFTQPVELAFNSADSSHYVVEKPGRVRAWWPSGASAPDAYLDITDRVNNRGNEQGLLGLAFSPDFARDGALYAYYIVAGDSARLSRFTAAVDAARVDAATEAVLATWAQPFRNHNGGSLVFGPDSLLYLAMGDGGSAGDPLDLAQDLTSPLGKILRFDVASAPGELRVPGDNPFADGADGRYPYIWSYGWRNPWRHGFDRATGDMWVADVGQDDREEISLEPAGSAGGLNYGWRCREGDLPFDTRGDCDGPFVEPVHVYRTERSGDGCSVSGGAVYRGARWPRMVGRYYFTDFCSGKVFELRPTPSGAYARRLVYEGSSGSYAAIREMRDGELVIVSLLGGELLRLENPCPADDLPAALTEQPTCAGDLGAASFDGPAGATYAWSTGETGSRIEQLSPGSYGLTVTEADGCQLLRDVSILPGDSSEVSPITRGGNDNLLLVSGGGFANFTWLYEGQVVQNGPDSTYAASGAQDGSYRVVGTTAAGCTDTSEVFVLVVGSVAAARGAFDLALVPNPARGQVRVRVGAVRGEAKLDVFASDGREVTAMRRVLAPSAAGHSLTLDLAGLPAGTYAVRLTGADGAAVRMLTVR